MARRFNIVSLGLVALLLSGPGWARAQQANHLENADDPAYRYKSPEGNFEVTWPSGCGKLRIIANEPEDFVGEEETNTVLLHLVICDRAELEGEGCSVAATFGARNAQGGEAGRDEVIARIRKTLASYGVKVVRQAPVRRRFTDDIAIEGVDVYGTRDDGTGQFRVRGILSYHDIYILTAWSMSGDLWDNPAYVEFFDGFRPYTE